MTALLHWLFEQVIIPLIRQTFYVTDTTPHRYRLFYFRHDLWEMVTKPALDRFCGTIFTPIGTVAHDVIQVVDVSVFNTTHTFLQAELIKILSNKDAGFSCVRLLPKEAGLRPIINLRRRLPLKARAPGKFFPSMNFLLQNPFKVLKFEKVGERWCGLCR